MSSEKDLLARREAVVPRAVGRLNDLVALSASGATISGADGRDYIDMATGIGVMSAGHTAPEVVRAVQSQAEKLQHACIHVATYEPYIALCETLAKKFPHGDATKVFLANTGAEAVENAIKIARQKTGKPGVICYTEAFHGRTLLCLSLTSKVGYKIGAGPFAPEVYRLPFPNYYKYSDGLSEADFVRRELRRFEDALVNTAAPSQVGCVLIEVVQGEGGFNPCPADYLRGLRKLCDAHGILLIIDEVQSGFCRTGKWAAYQHSGVVPDLSTWAKAMGGGLPISAVVGRADVMDAGQPGTLGGTFGGNPLACASALATIELMERQKLDARAVAIGQTIRSRLTALKSEVALVGDVRGLGAMMAVELVLDGDPHRPASAQAKAVIANCVKEGVLVISAGAHGNVVRLLPPLVISDAELDRALSVLESSIRSAAQ